MRRKASLILTAGSIIFSGAFLLLSLNYANNMGLFYTDSAKPALYFSNQLEAAMSGVYASPEETTIEYSGPRSCEWNNEILEYDCGGATIKNIGASVGFTQNQITMGFPLTGCLYLDFLTGLISKALKSRKANKVGALSATYESVLKELKAGVKELSGKEVVEIYAKIAKKTAT